jgi:hypothetical protein
LARCQWIFSGWVAGFNNKGKKMNNKQVAHLWANKSRESASGSHFYFDGDTIYSYGSHFPIARHYKGVVLFTSNGHSVTTTRHKSITSSACSHLTVFEVSDVMATPSGKDVREYGEQIKAEAMKLAKARKPDVSFLERAVNEANAFCDRFGFKTRFAMPDNMAELREKAKAQAIKDRKAQADKQARIDADNEELAQRWIAGEQVSLPYNYGKVLLRAKHIAGKSMNGNEPDFMAMQTSKGATVPLVEAEKAFRFVMLKRSTGWHRNGDSFQVGEFHLDSVNEQGVIAGCHRIAWDEIERFAKAQNWI